MYIPGRDCVLHAIHLRFVAPIRPPVRLRVYGELKTSTADYGRVETTITDAETGARYVDGAYEFGHHTVSESGSVATPVRRNLPAADDVVLVTGANGGLGRAVVSMLGSKAVPVSRSLQEVEQLDGQRVSAIVHCGWPAPDNSRLIDLPDATTAVDNHVAGPLRQSIALARVMARVGLPDAVLVLVGSTAALPGRHAYRAPLYSLGKTLMPELARVLAVELGSTQMRCVAVVFDVIEAGMNAHLTSRARLAHVDRSPAGRIPGGADAASQIEWVLSNRSFLLSGATVTLTGGALP
jgi:NAD(P)-dependent dehydrogenase (short-subunit alcohol dehydrogenase family)